MNNGIFTFAFIWTDLLYEIIIDVIIKNPKIKTKIKDSPKQNRLEQLGDKIGAFIFVTVFWSSTVLVFKLFPSLELEFLILFILFHFKLTKFYI